MEPINATSSNQTCSNCKSSAPHRTLDQRLVLPAAQLCSSGNTNQLDWATIPSTCSRDEQPPAPFGIALHKVWAWRSTHRTLFLKSPLYFSEHGDMNSLERLFHIQLQRRGHAESVRMVLWESSGTWPGDRNPGIFLHGPSMPVRTSNKEIGRAHV